MKNSLFILNASCIFHSSLNEMLYYALCLSYHSNTEAILFACLSSGWATQRLDCLAKIRFTLRASANVRDYLDDLYRYVK